MMEHERRPVLLKELGEVRSIFIRFAAMLFIIALLMLAVGTPSLATQLFTILRDYLVPPGVSVIALGPLSPFIAPISVAFMVAFILSFPYFLFLLARYIAPALYGRERQSLSFLFFSSIALFFLGCIFAYIILIPYTLATLYSFAGPLGVTPFFSLDSFVGTVFGLTISTGIAFLIPSIMVTLSSIGIVPARLWKSHWRAAALIVFVFSALITPDGSGVTMVILSVPLLLLYGAGVLFSSRKELGGFTPKFMPGEPRVDNDRQHTGY